MRSFLYFGVKFGVIAPVDKVTPTCNCMLDRIPSLNFPKVKSCSLL